MDYSRIYYELMLKANTRQRPNCYTEEHHILPKSLGGSDHEGNLVDLTLKEHRLAHMLLTRIHYYTHPNHVFAIYAFYEDANPERLVLRKRAGWFAGWVRRYRTRAISLQCQKAGREAATKWNAKSEKEKQKWLSNLGWRELD